MQVGTRACRQVLSVCFHFLKMKMSLQLFFLKKSAGTDSHHVRGQVLMPSTRKDNDRGSLENRKFVTLSPSTTRFFRTCLY